jgi:hypothetical protein
MGRSLSDLACMQIQTRGIESASPPRVHLTQEGAYREAWYEAMELNVCVRRGGNKAKLVVQVHKEVLRDSILLRG